MNTNINENTNNTTFAEFQSNILLCQRQINWLGEVVNEALYVHIDGEWGDGKDLSQEDHDGLIEYLKACAVARRELFSSRDSMLDAVEHFFPGKEKEVWARIEAEHGCEPIPSLMDDHAEDRQ